MIKKSVSIKMDVKLIEAIDMYARSRHMTRTGAIVSMLNNVRVVVISEGAELIKLLHSLERLIKTNEISYADKEKLEGVCMRIWQLLSLITEKVQGEIEE